jgi:Na+/H+ antiporter NhaC
MWQLPLTYLATIAISLSATTLFETLGACSTLLAPIMASLGANMHDNNIVKFLK